MMMNFYNRTNVIQKSYSSKLSTLQANTIWKCLQINFYLIIFLVHFVLMRHSFTVWSWEFMMRLLIRKQQQTTIERWFRETRMWHPGEFQVKVSSITSNIIQQHNTVNSHQYISQDNTHQWLPPETKLIKPSRIFPLHNINTTLFSKIITRYEIYCY